jgi:hypothetical protein
MSDGRGAFRLTFSYEGRRLELVDVQEVDAVVPEPPASEHGRAGYWLELNDGGGRSVFRRVLHEPVGESVEVFSDDPERPFQRATVEKPAGTFQVMVPAVDEGEVSILHVESKSAKRKKDADRGRELGRFKVSRGRGRRSS